MIYYSGMLKDFVTADEFVEKYGVGKGGYVQKVIDAAVIRECFPYVPFDEGALAGSANTATEIGSGEVVYDQPYAHYQYYGEIWGPNIPIVENGVIVGYRSPPEKHPTGRQLNFDNSREKNGPLAGSHWFDRAMADHAKDVLKEAQDAANRGSNP
jgi:hypothetical protein